MRYALTLSYDGRGFCGWQVQPREPSVQEALQKALETLLGRPTPVTGAGRTDTDVNALGYVAHFDCEGPLPYESGDFLYKLNAILPTGIAVSALAPVADDFHARFDARRRTYLYFIHFRKDPFVERYSWHCKFGLDVEKMNEACRYLLGTHDFSCFEKKGADSKTAICTVFDAHWEWYEPTLQRMGKSADKPDTAGPVTSESEGKRITSDCEGKRMGDDGTEGRYLCFRISANRFLRNMVRAIVGTMVEVGRGRLSPEDIPAILDSKDRCRAGQSVPGNALFLASVEY